MDAKDVVVYTSPYPEMAEYVHGLLIQNEIPAQWENTSAASMYGVRLGARVKVPLSYEAQAREMIAEYVETGEDGAGD